MLLPFVNWKDPIRPPCCSVASRSVSYCLCSCGATIDWRTCCCEQMMLPDVDVVAVADADTRRCQETLTMTLLMAHCRRHANNSLAIHPNRVGQLDGQVLLEESEVQPCYGSFFACPGQWLKIWQICLMSKLVHTKFVIIGQKRNSLDPGKYLFTKRKSDCISV